MPSLLALSLPLLLASTLPLPAASSIATNAPNGAPLSERVVAYDIDARIDVDRKSLDATETLTYRNLTGQPLTSFPFHLYLNAFRPQSTFARETHADSTLASLVDDNGYPDERLGDISITHLDADGYGDLGRALRFAAPDDGNAQDHTVAIVTLSHPVAPGDSVIFHLAFHDQLPLSVARNGYKRDFLMGSQWFPKVGVFWHGAWNCHQYHATTEFFSDFGTYDVHLTLPRRYVVGASGVPTGDLANFDGTRTLSFRGEDIHDFAWAASPHFVPTDGVFLSALGPVKVHVLALAAHPGAGSRYLAITLASLAKFDQWFGPYPYKQITVIDPEPGSEIGGMEYPTLITGGTSWYEPTYLTELTAEHEFGHQYWYGMVATNEFEDAWLDEGVNSYTEIDVNAAINGAGTSILRRRWANFSDTGLLRLEYLLEPGNDPVTRAAWRFRDAASYGAITYGKSAMLLKTLEGIVGPDTMREALRTYFLRYRFTHPSTADLLRTIEQVSLARGRATGAYTPVAAGTPPAHALPSAPAGLAALLNTVAAAPPTLEVSNSSLRPFFDQAVYGAALLDYEVASISSDPLRWWEPDTSRRPDAPRVQTVTLHRIGDFILPVTVEITFSDGSRRREHWDGADRWTRFTYTQPAAIVAAEIDPDHTVLLDRDLFNNSRTAAGSGIASAKLTALWVLLQQSLQQLASWLV